MKYSSAAGLAPKSGDIIMITMIILIMVIMITMITI